jgi:hypothetical protein
VPTYFAFQINEHNFNWIGDIEAGPRVTEGNLIFGCCNPTTTANFMRSENINFINSLKTSHRPKNLHLPKIQILLNLQLQW